MLAPPRFAGAAGPTAGELAHRVAAAVGVPAPDADRGWYVLADATGNAGDAGVRCDESTRTVRLVRDALGENGLVWARCGRDVVFASEIAELLALLPQRPGPDAAALAHWLAIGGMPGDRTLYDGVQRVVAGHVVEIDAGGGTRSWRHWEPRYRSPPPIGLQDAAEQVAAAIAEAIRGGSAGSAATAMMLSGGIDSGAVAAVASHSGEDVAPERAYSAVFPAHPRVDESGEIAEVASALGLHGTRAVVRGGSALAGVIPYLERWQLPPVSPNLFFWEPLLRRAAQDGTSVLLDGQGGDELFNLSPYLLADRLRAGRVTGALALMRSVPGSYGRPPREAVVGWMRQYALRGALPPGLHGRVRGLRGQDRHVPPILGPAARRAYLDTEDPHGWKRIDGPRWWAWLVEIATRGVGPQVAFDHQRRRDAMHGLRARHPLADPRLVELVLGFPPELAFSPERNRPVLRAAVAGTLPDRVRLRPDKSSFDEIFHDSLAGVDLPAVRRLLGAEDTLLPAHADPRILREEIVAGPDAHPHGRQAWALDTWRAATAELWLRAQRDPGEPARILGELGLPAPDVAIEPAVGG